MAGSVARPACWPQTALSGRAAVLVIDADAGRRRYIGRILRAAGCAVAGFADPAAARPALAEQRCDVVLLSLAAPGEDSAAAIDACRPARAVPVLVLLEDDGGEAVAHMLEAGADDCLTAPFDASDLSARILRLLHLVWRRHGVAAPDGKASLQLDPTRLCVRREGQEIRLSKLEYRMLWVLAQGRGAVLPFRDIETRVWGEGDKPHRRALRRVIYNLRRKLGDDLLLAEPRVGYRLQVSKARALPSTRQRP
jgi:DNA-binding response OmpR family regulator